MKQKIVIIGTGLAGYNLSKNIRAINQEIEITLITQGEGHFYSKPMLSTALAQKKSADDLIMFRKEEMATHYNLNIVSLATVKNINPTTQTVSYLRGKQEGKMNYTHLVLALGATPNAIDLPKHPDIFQINQWEDYRAFRAKLSGYQHIGIIGSGLVGCEFAHDLAAHTQVSLFSPERCLARWLAPNVSTQVEQALSSLGTNLYTQGSITTVSTDPLTIHGKKDVQVDAIIAAIGLKPNIELAAHSGIQTHHGILVNEFCETSIKNVYAIGDCMEYNGQVLQFVAPLMHQAQKLAQTLTGNPTPLQYAPMPINCKTMSYPVLHLDPLSDEGAWHIENVAGGMVAKYQVDSILKGFTLTGAAIKERMKLIQELA